MAAEELAGGVRFRLEHVSKHYVVLHNDGVSSAYGVYVDTGSLDVHQGSVTLDEFPSGHGEDYLFTKGRPGRTEIVVTWHHRHDRFDDPRTLRLPIDIRKW